MVVRKRGATLLRVLAWLVVLLPLVVLAGCTDRQFPQTTLTPRSDYAWSIQHLLDTLVFWVIVIFVLVEGALIFTVLRFRDRPGREDPRHVHGHTGLEVAWTIAPAVLLGFIAIPTVLTIFHTQANPPKGALEVKVVGHQWWWEFQYPKLGVVTANELHVPVHQAVLTRLETADVIHSFWFPAMGGKRDVVPAHTNQMWFTADTTGTFMGQCAELCGMSHANMRMRLVVETPEAFAAWIQSQKAPPVEPDSTSPAGKGKAAFLEVGCVACHTIEGVSPGTVGPNLTHVASRTTIAGAIFPNDAEHLGRWLQNPPERKPGSIMPNLNLTPEQVSSLVAYLQSLK